MRKASKQTDCLSLRLDKEISDKLQKFCKDTGFSKTKVIENSLDEYLKKNTVSINGVNAIVIGKPGEGKENPSIASLLFSDMSKNLKKAKKGERLILTKNHFVPINEHKNLNTLVIGCPGSGVESSFIKPNLLDMPRDTSFVITDIGGEIWRDTHEIMEKAGYDVIYFNPYDIEHTLKYSPLNYCRTEEQAQEIAEAIYELTKTPESGDGIWEIAGKNLLSAIILQIFESGDDTKSKLINKLPEKIKGFLSDADVEKYYEECKEGDYNPIFRNKYGSSKTISERTSAAVAANLEEQLKVMKEDGFKELTSNDELKIYTLFNHKTVVYIGFGLMDKTYDFLSRMALAECIKEVFKRNSERPQPYHVRFMLNNLTEIGDIRKELPTFPMILATNRKYGMSFQMIIQNITQLRSLYDKEMCELIMINCHYILVLGTKNLDTCEYLSNISGKEIIDNGGIAHSKNILNVSDISSLSASKAILFENGERPVIDEKYWMPKQEESFDIKIGEG